MGLIKCKECKEEISRAAKTCPKCGAKNPGNNISCCSAVFLIFFILMMVVWSDGGCSFSSDLDSKRRELSEREKKEPKTKEAKEAKVKAKATKRRADTGDIDTAWIMAKDFVTQRLKSPSTADFGGVFSGEYQRASVCCAKTPEGLFIASGWVDSQNGFGATIRTKWSCTLKYMGNDTWKCLSLNFK